MPQSRSRRFRVSRAGVWLALGGLALLVVGGVVGALVFARPANAAVPAPMGTHSATGAAPGRHGAPGAGPGRRGPGEQGGPRRGAGHHDGAGADAIVGVVDSTGQGTLVVTPDGAAQRTITTDTSTRVAGGGQNALSGLKAGQRVVVRVQGTGTSAKATAVRVVTPHVVGTVTALNGTSATVTTVDGLTVPVDVSAAPQKPVVGDRIAATGTTNGTGITATQVRVLPKGP